MSLVGGAISGGAITKGLDWLSTRGQSKARIMGAVDHAVETAMNLVTDRLERVEEQHAECQESLREVRDELAETRAEIARLLVGRVAG
jgi:hypothetical protein